MGLMKKLTSAVVASSLVLGLVGTAAADFSPAGVNAAAARMQALNVVKGVLQPDGTTDLMLGKNITRAELVTIIVRAFGQSETAKIVKGYPAFTDTADHWASGEIAVAKNVIESKGHTLGVTATTFVPNKDVTAGEAIAFLMKFLGIKADSTQSWPMDYISGAVKAGLITEADKTALTVSPNTPATRGLVFYFADQAFGEYKTADGKNVYNTYVDTQAPVVTVDSYEANTTATEVTLTGTASGQSVLHVGSTQNIVTVGADGKWSTTVKLELGENDIWVHALDAAGNAGVPASAVKITRNAGAAATVEASLAETSVAAGSTTDLTVKVLDANGAELANPEYTATVEGNIGTFENGKFTAAKVTGTGKLVVTSGDATTTIDINVVAGPLAKVAADKTAVAPGGIVTLSAQDEFGNAITSGVTFSQTSADAMLDNGKFMASKAGTYTITATAGDKTATLNIGVYGSAAKVVVSAPAQVVGNTDGGTYTGSTYEIKAMVADSNGNTLATATENVTLTLPAGFTLASGYTALQAAKDGVVTWKVVADKTAVGSIGTFTATGTTTVSGTAISGTANVEVIGQVATGVKLDAPSSEFIRANAANSDVTTTLYLVDQNGKRFLGAGQTISLSLSGPATFTAGALTAKTTGDLVYSGSPITVTFNSKTGETGAIALTATSAGLGTSSANLTASIAGSAKLVKVKVDRTEAIANENATTDGTINVSVQVTDAAGVPVTGTYALKATFNTDSYGEILVGGTALTGKTHTFSTGATGSATFAVKADTFTGPLTFTVAENGTAAGLSGQDVAVAFKADAATTVKLSRTAVNVAATAPTATLSAQLYDGSDNKVAKAGVKVTFTGYTSADVATNDVTLNGTAKTVDVYTDANGVATVNVSVLGYVGATYKVGIASSGLTATDVMTATVANSVAASITTSIRNAGDTLTLVSAEAGTSVLLKGTLKDNNGKVIAGDTITLKLAKDSALTTAGAAITNDTMTTTTAADGTFSFQLMPVKAGSFTFTLEDSTSATTLTSTASMNILPTAVTAAKPAKLVVAEANTSGDVAVTAGTLAGPYTLKLVDFYGNTVTATSAVTVSVGVTSGATGVRATADGIDAAAVTIPAGASQTTFYVMVGTGSDYDVTFAGTYGGQALTPAVLGIDR